MALIHEKMYQSHKLSQVCFDEYIRELVTDIFQSYEVHSEKIRLEFDLEPVSLDVNTAMPCALILNELTSNTLKYAFPESHKGTMSIVMRRISHETIFLLFKDDGKGLPPEVDLENTKTLGLRLVRVLTRQLKGSVELTPGSGTSYNFLIPLS
jgi:two-component sensor histidine kinase